MTKNQKIVLGVGAVVVFFYVYMKNKWYKGFSSPTDPNNPRTSPIPNNGGVVPPIPNEGSRFNCQSGKPFTLKDNYINGIIPNLTGGTTTAQAMPNILFKKGDLVCGDVITQYIFNKNMKGILAKPTIKGSYSDSPMQFIPIEYLTPLSDS